MFYWLPCEDTVATELVILQTWQTTHDLNEIWFKMWKLLARKTKILFQYWPSPSWRQRLLVAVQNALKEQFLQLHLSRLKIRSSFAILMTQKPPKAGIGNILIFGSTIRSLGCIKSALRLYYTRSTSNRSMEANDCSHTGRGAATLTASVSKFSNFSVSPSDTSRKPIGNAFQTHVTCAYIYRSHLALANNVDNELQTACRRCPYNEHSNRTEEMQTCYWVCLDELPKDHPNQKLRWLQFARTSLKIDVFWRPEPKEAGDDAVMVQATALITETSLRLQPMRSRLTITNCLGR